MADETLKSFVEKCAINFNCNAEMNTANQALVLIRKLAEKLDTDGVGSSPVQPDWSQNNEAASDYIKNRPGGYTVNYPALNIEWDGVIGDRVSVDVGEMKFVKVSDEIPKVEQLVGGTMSVKQGDMSDAISITYDDIFDYGNGIYRIGGE